MKSFKLTQIHETKNLESQIEHSRVRLPHLPKSQSKCKRGKAPSRLDSTPTKYEQLVEEIADLQNCVSRKYGKNIRIESLRKMQKSIHSLNHDLTLISRNTNIKTAKEFVRSTSSSSSEDIKASDSQAKWSKRLKLSKRPEMASKVLVVIVFEGVIGDLYTDNMWQDKEPKLHIRKGLAKGIQILRQHFQLALMIKSCYPNTTKLLNFFNSKNLKFDAIYQSDNEAKWKSKNSALIKRKFKYSDHVQDFSQVSKDFHIEGEEISRMLVVTSTWPESQDSGIDSVILNFHSIPQYLCKSVPLLQNPDHLLPVTLAVPDPRATGEGDSFRAIAELVVKISHLSHTSEEQSWIDGFAKIRQEGQLNCTAFETSAYQYGLLRDKVKVSRVQAESFIEEEDHCICQYDIKNLCKSRNFGRCTVRSKLKQLKMTGNEIPTSLHKNKFIIFKLHRPGGYKIVNGF